MADLDIPDFVLDPPLVAHFSGDEAARQWLQRLVRGTLRSGKRPELIKQLAAMLNASEQQIATILRETDFRCYLKRELLYFDAAPHEIEAKQQFVALAEMTHRLRSDVYIHADKPDYAIGDLSRHRADGPDDGLIQQWRAWKVTFEAMVARNPVLELRERMHEVFENHLFVSWEIGSERLLEEWIERGTREPMPFLDSRHILTDAYYKRLCELRALSPGWFHYNNDVGAIVYVPRPEWKAHSATWPTKLDWACRVVAEEGGP